MWGIPCANQDDSGKIIPWVQTMADCCQSDYLYVMQSVYYSITMVKYRNVGDGNIQHFPSLHYYPHSETYCHRRWLSSMMSDPLSNGMLVVQTIRNSLMASTLLATASITLSSLIGVFMSNTTSNSSASELVYGNTTQLVHSIKYMSILLCFLTAFLCNVQSIRYYTQVSFLATLPTSKDAVRCASRSLDRGTFFWSLGLRAFYLSFPLFLWIFGPIPMLSCSCIMRSLCISWIPPPPLRGNFTVFCSSMEMHKMTISNHQHKYACKCDNF